MVEIGDKVIAIEIPTNLYVETEFSIDQHYTIYDIHSVNHNCHIQIKNEQNKYLSYWYSIELFEILYVRRNEIINEILS